MNLLSGKVFFGFCSLIFLFTACATTHAPSPMQRRSVQSRVFQNVSYSNVFRATKTVLQDEGYIIKEQDYEGGMLLATAQKSNWSWEMTKIFKRDKGDDATLMGTEFEVSFNFEDLGHKNIETRLTIQKVDHYSNGGKQGKEVFDLGLYKNIYEKITVEIERRKALGRSFQEP